MFSVRFLGIVQDVPCRKAIVFNMDCLWAWNGSEIPNETSRPHSKDYNCNNQRPQKIGWPVIFRFHVGIYCTLPE